MFSFKYDRYSSKPISDNAPYISMNDLYNSNKTLNIANMSIDEMFNQYISSIEKERGYKCSRQERRKLYKKFVKNK